MSYKISSEKIDHPLLNAYTDIDIDIDKIKPFPFP